MAYFERNTPYPRKYYMYLNMVHEAQLPRRHEEWEFMSPERKKQWIKKVDNFEKALFNGDMDQY